MSRFNKIFYFINITTLATIVVIIVVGIAFAWNAPNNVPPISTNQALYVNSSGNVGIGTTNPTQKLDVAGYINAQTGLCFNGNCRSSWYSFNRTVVSSSATFNNGAGEAYVSCPSGYTVVGCQGLYSYSCFGSWACEYLGGWFWGNGCAARAYSDGQAGATTIYVYANCIAFN